MTAPTRCDQMFTDSLWRYDRERIESRKEAVEGR